MIRSVGNIRKIVAMVALLAAMLPIGGAHAESVTVAQFQPPYALGPQGGDAFNQFQRDANTGTMTVLRVNPAGISGGLGCSGLAGYSNFEVSFTGTDVRKVSVFYNQALVDPYSYINVGVRQGSNYLGSTVLRGLLAGNGTATVTLPSAANGDLVVWFGIQVGSACPNIDGARAVFESVAFFMGG